VSRPHPKEFRDDVVAVARRGEAPIAQIAKDFGISDSCLRNWLAAADVADGHRPGAAANESAELRDLKRLIANQGVAGTRGDAGAVGASVPG